MKPCASHMLLSLSCILLIEESTFAFQFLNHWAIGSPERHRHESANYMLSCLKTEATATAEWLQSVELVNLHEVVVGHFEVLRFVVVPALD